jgi:hypothetical protein
MKKITKALNVLASVYYCLMIISVSSILLMALATAFYHAALYLNLDFALFISTSKTPSTEELKESFRNFFEISFLLTNIFLIIILYLNSEILKKISLFLNAKGNSLNLKNQKTILTSISKFIFLTYIISFVSILLPETASTEANIIVTFIEKYGEFFIPEFGNAIGIVMALIIYAYAKTIDEQEQLSDQIEKLKQESELVI